MATHDMEPPQIFSAVLSQLTQAVTGATASKATATWRECAVAELLDEHKPAGYLPARDPWFISASFAAHYADDGATRALCWERDGQLLVRCFSRTTGRGQIILRFNGGWCGSQSELRDYMRTSGVNVTVFSMLDAKELLAFREATGIVAVRRLLDDRVVALPTTPEAYLLSLGTQTRKHLPYYQRRLDREFPGRLRYRTERDGGIGVERLRQVVELSRLRIERKGYVHGWNEAMIERRSRLNRQGGQLFAIEIDGRVAAGTWSCLHGREAFLLLIGHDPRFDKYSLGSLCLWHSINALIAVGINRFHLLWGESTYKRQFGGVEEMLYEACVFACWQDKLLWRTVISAKLMADLGKRGLNAGIRRLSQFLPR